MQDFADRLVGGNAAGANQRRGRAETIAEHAHSGAQPVHDHVDDRLLERGAQIGDGFYGVDLKQTDSGIVVMEVNDNPNLEHGIEDVVGKDEIWMRLLRWFVERFEQ